MDRKRISQQPEAADPDPVELSGMDSFPASDPPSWVPVHPGRPAPPVAPEPDISGKADPQVDDLLDRDPGEEQIELDLPVPERIHRGSSG